MASTVMLRRVLSLPTQLRRSIWTSSISKDQTYDVVCIGGGPAGLALISALQSHPLTRELKMALIDSQSLVTQPQNTSDSTFSNRCVSLTPSSVSFLQQIGAWDNFSLARTQPYHGMEVWDGVSGSKIQFDPLDRQTTGFLGSLVEVVPGNRFQAGQQHSGSSGRGAEVATMCETGNITAALLSQVKKDERLRVLDMTKVEAIQLGLEPQNAEEADFSQWPVITTSQGDITARLLVGADGANSPVRKFADIPSPGWDYDQHGVVATLTLDRACAPDDIRIAYQRFLPTGTVALLPLPNNKASLVWSISSRLASQLKQFPHDDFVAMVNAAFRLLPIDLEYILQQSEPPSNRVDELTWRMSSTSSTETGLPASLPQVIGVQEGSVASFPLRMRHASTYTGHRVALIGDAAHSVHPLAGQGLNLGLADAASLAQRVAYGVEHGMDIGSCWCLDNYNSDRWAANNAMLGVVDKLQKLYSVRSGPVVWGRSLGLNLIERLGPVKGLLMNAASR